MEHPAEDPKGKDSLISTKTALFVLAGLALLLVALGTHGNGGCSEGLLLGQHVHLRPVQQGKAAEVLQQPVQRQCGAPSFRQPDWYSPRLPTSSEVLLRALRYNGAAPRLHRFVEKLLRGLPVSVTALGGSITSGAGAFGGPDFVGTFFSWLNSTFPHPGHTLKNAGMPATTAAVFAVCIDDFVTPDADLILIETAYNEEMKDCYDKYALWPYELLLRTLLSMPSQPEVLIFSTYSYPFDRWGKDKDLGRYSNSMEDWHTILAKYYELPELSLRSAAYHLMRRNVSGFEWHIDYTNHSTLFVDLVHPSRKGHLLLADLLIRTFWHIATCLDPCLAGGTAPLGCVVPPLAADAVRHGGGDSSSGAGLASRADTAKLEVNSESSGNGSAWDGGGLPGPMLFPSGDGPGGERYSCLSGRKFEALGSSAGGNFSYVAQRPERATFALQKWAWVGSAPGAWVELRLNTQSPGEMGQQGEQQQQQQQQQQQEQEQEQQEQHRRRRRGLLTDDTGAGGSNGEDGPSNSPETPPDAGPEPLPASGETGGKPTRMSKVALGYMKSYSSMGMANVTCVANCTCAPSTIDGWWGPPVQPMTLVRPHIFEVSPHPHCVLRVEVLNETHTEGHKVQLQFVSVSPSAD